MILADKIIYLRKKNGWSQEDLAEELHVSRQSVSKWESAQSVPDLDKILQLSWTFGVTTDCLLKDDAEIEASGEPAEESGMRKVSMEEASSFLAARKISAGRISKGVMMCILSPILLILLTGASEYGVLPLSENAAGGIGVGALLVLVASAVAVFIYDHAQNELFEYLEKEPFETAYGVEGMVKQERDQYRQRHTQGITVGICLCILSAIPLLISEIIQEEGMFAVASVCILLGIVAVGVNRIVASEIPWSAMKCLLQIEDYSVQRKKMSEKGNVISGIYWSMVTAGYLAYSFVTSDWSRSWIVWPVAAVLFGGISAIYMTSGSKDLHR
jgi:transcriptional regulator with XRE-family HTH domain